MYKQYITSNGFIIMYAIGCFQTFFLYIFINLCDGQCFFNGCSLFIDGFVSLLNLSNIYLSLMSDIIKGSLIQLFWQFHT